MQGGHKNYLTTDFMTGPFLLSISFFCFYFLSPMSAVAKGSPISATAELLLTNVTIGLSRDGNDTRRAYSY